MAEDPAWHVSKQSSNTRICSRTPFNLSKLQTDLDSKDSPESMAQRSCSLRTRKHFLVSCDFTMSLCFLWHLGLELTNGPCAGLSMAAMGVLLVALFSLRPAPIYLSPGTADYPFKSHSSTKEHLASLLLFQFIPTLCHWIINNLQMALVPLLFL